MKLSVLLTVLIAIAHWPQATFAGEVVDAVQPAGPSLSVDLPNGAKIDWCMFPPVSF